MDIKSQLLRKERPSRCVVEILVEKAWVWGGALGPEVANEEHFDHRQQTRMVIVRNSPAWRGSIIFLSEARQLLPTEE